MEKDPTTARLDAIESKLDVIVNEIELQRARRHDKDALAQIVERMESVNDFLKDASPLMRESFISLMYRLDEFDRKGYFGFVKEMGKVVDNVVTSFAVEDVRRLGENIVTIMNTVKSMTQPDMLHAVNNALTMYKKMDLEVEEDVSLLALLREMNTPEARRGMAFAVRFMKSIAAHNGTPSTNV
jgi:uncharacterized protein YjgD (DUF1641 family)